MTELTPNKSDPAQTRAREVGPLSDQSLRELGIAARRWRQVRGATRLAAFNGISLAAVAGLALLGGLGQMIAAAASGQPAIGGLSGLALGLAVGAVAIVEFRGRARLLRLDPSGATMLAWNQLALLALVAVWCGWKLYQGVAGPNPYEDAIRDTPELAGMLEPIVQAYATITFFVYVAVLGVSAVFQGYCARRYFTAHKQTRAYLAATAPWMVQVLRLAA